MIIAPLRLKGSYPSYLKRLARRIVEGIASEDAIHTHQELYGYVIELLDNCNSLVS